MGFRIRFLGSGGSRYVTYTQLRRTAGFLIEDGDLFLHVDPGPGTARAYRDLKENMSRINTLFVSHIHIDHSLETPVLIEAITNGLKRRRGRLIASISVVEGSNGFSILSEEHRKYIEIIPVKPFDRVGNLTILPAKHTDPHTVGFLYEGKRTVTYFSDTGYWEGMEKYAKDISIFNLSTLHPSSTHTSPEVVERAAVNSKVIILTGFGMSVIKKGVEKIVKELRASLSGEVIGAYDGMEWGGLLYFQ